LVSEISDSHPLFHAKQFQRELDDFFKALPNRAEIVLDQTDASLYPSLVESSSQPGYRADKICVGGEEEDGGYIEGSGTKTVGLG